MNDTTKNMTTSYDAVMFNSNRNVVSALINTPSVILGIVIILVLVIAIISILG
jgi:hypothetical protein